MTQRGDRGRRFVFTARTVMVSIFTLLGFFVFVTDPGSV